MKTNLISLILTIATIVTFTACDKIFDRDANYSYIIQNNTNAAIAIVVEIKANPGVNIQGSPYRNYTIQPGSKVNVWSTSGFTTDEVYDEEQKNGELYWFRVAATNYSGGNLNSINRWQYKKESNYKATYTLVLE